MRLAGPGRLGVVVFDLVGQDCHQVAVGEPLDGRRRAQRAVDFGGAVQFGQGDCVGHLRPDVPDPCLSCFLQPERRSRPDGQELRFGRGGRLGDPLVAGALWVVRVVDARVARRGAGVPGDLDRLAVHHRGHDQVLAVEPDPHAVLDEGMRHRVADRVDLDRRVLAHTPALAERRGERPLGHRVQPLPLLGQHLGWDPAGLAVVVTEQFWETWFDRAPDVIGRKLIIANVPFTVVGVMPKRFIGADPTHNPQIYAPLSADPIIDAPRNHIENGIHSWWLTVGARLQPGTTLAQANASLATVSRPILHAASDDAEFIGEEEKGHFHFVAEPGSRGFAYARLLFRRPLLAMFSMCGGILLLACLNLAGLLMARGAARERELATRLAIGATRRRLIQQLLVESLLIAILGTAAGLAVAPLVSRSFSALLLSSDSGQVLDTSLDVRVLCFAACVAVISAVLIGLVPALEATAGNVHDQIKDGQHARQRLERRRILPRILLASEVALALVLVVGAGLLATSMVRLFQSGVGFDPKGLVNISFRMDKQQLEGDALMRQYQQLAEGLSRQPGVKKVSFEFIVPLSHRGWNGRYGAQGAQPQLMYMNSVGPDYFATMRIPLYQGREFTWADSKASGLKITLNRSAAELLFPGEEALGQQVIEERSHSTYQVVAVVGDTKYRDMREPAPASGYIPIMQDEQKKPSLTAVVRTDGPQVALASAARSLAARLAPTIPTPTLSTMNEVLNDAVSTERMMALLSVFFAGCALLVTGIGLYGTLAYATARRTSEIGIRMALGAQRMGVMVLVFRENALVASIGSVAGLTIALLVSRALGSFLYGTSPRDPWVLLGSVAALTLIASVASLLPALRAARIEPMAAIRCE